MVRQLRSEAGFTVLELVIAISIIAILAVFLLAKYDALKPAADQQATNSIAAALNVASTVNYHYFRIGSAKAVPVHNCTDTANALPPSQPLSPGYTITSQIIAPNATATCIVTNPDGNTTASFIGRGTT